MTAAGRADVHAGVRVTGPCGAGRGPGPACACRRCSPRLTFTGGPGGGHLRLLEDRGRRASATRSPRPAGEAAGTWDPGSRRARHTWPLTTRGAPTPCRLRLNPEPLPGCHPAHRPAVSAGRVRDMSRTPGPADTACAGPCCRCRGTATPRPRVRPERVRGHSACCTAGSTRGSGGSFASGSQQQSCPFVHVSSHVT